MLAARLGMSLQRCQKETTASEFVEWHRFLRDEWQVPKREDYYLAQIAAEVRRTIARTPGNVKSDDFLLKFKFPSKERVLTEAEKEQRMHASKARWLALVGVKGGQKK